MSGKLRIERVVTDVGDRLVKVAICTHGHNDHVTAAPELAERLHAPVPLHPGATTGRSYTDFPTTIGSIRDRLFALPEETLVRTGHGDGTTIGTEAPHLVEWIARGQ